MESDQDSRVRASLTVNPAYLQNSIAPLRLKEVPEAFLPQNVELFYLLDIGDYPLGKSQNLKVYTLN